MKYPAHLYTIEISFGPEVPVFSEHFRDADMAGSVLRSLKAKMYDSNGAIYGLRLYHKGQILSHYFPNPAKPRWVWVPPPDADGVRHIPPKAKPKARIKPPIAVGDLDLEILPARAKAQCATATLVVSHFQS